MEINVHYDGRSRTFDFLGNRMDQFESDKAMIDQTICEKSKLTEFRKNSQFFRMLTTLH